MELNRKLCIHDILTNKDLKDVQASLWEVRTKWYNIGIQLEVSVEELNAIRVRHSNNPDECLTELLAHWLRNALQPAWTLIVKALQSPTVKFDELASKIENDKLDSSSQDSNSCAQQIAKRGYSTDSDRVVSDSFRSISEFQGLSDEQKEELEQMLTMETDNIKMKFSILRNKFFESLDKQVLPVKKLVRDLNGLEELKTLELPRAMIANQTPLKDIDNLEIVKDIIESLSTFFDYRPVKYMIELDGNEEDKQRMKEYEEDFDHYIKRRVFECPSKIGASRTPNCTELRVKFESSHNIKLIALKQLQCRLSLILGVSVHVLRLSSFKEGCIELTFLISNAVKEAIFPFSAEQKDSLVEQDMIMIHCDSYHWQTAAGIKSGSDSNNNSNIPDKVESPTEEVKSVFVRVVSPPASLKEEPGPMCHQYHGRTAHTEDSALPSKALAMAYCGAGLVGSANVELEKNYRVMLLKIANELTHDECEQVAFVAKLPSPTCASEPGKMNVRLHLMSTLESLGHIGPLNVDFLETMLDAVGKKNLLEIIDQYKKSALYKEAKKRIKDQKKIEKKKSRKKSKFPDTQAAECSIAAHESSSEEDTEKMRKFKECYTTLLTQISQVTLLVRSAIESEDLVKIEHTFLSIASDGDMITRTLLNNLLAAGIRSGSNSSNSPVESPTEKVTECGMVSEVYAELDPKRRQLEEIKDRQTQSLESGDYSGDYSGGTGTGDSGVGDIRREYKPSQKSLDELDPKLRLLEDSEDRQTQSSEVGNTDERPRYMKLKTVQKPSSNAYGYMKLLQGQSFDVAGPRRNVVGNYSLEHYTSLRKEAMKDKHTVKTANTLPQLSSLQQSSFTKAHTQLKSSSQSSTNEDEAYTTLHPSGTM